MLRHLAPGSAHTFSIRASDGSVNSTTSNAVTVTTQASSDVTPPSEPGNPRILFDQGCGEIWLGFDQATDDVDPQAVIEYEVYVNGQLRPLPARAGVSTEFVYGIVNGLNTFTVKAVDRTGNMSVASNAVSTQLWLAEPGHWRSLCLRSGGAKLCDHGCDDVGGRASSALLPSRVQTRGPAKNHREP